LRRAYGPPILPGFGGLRNCEGETSIADALGKSAGQFDGGAPRRRIKVPQPAAA